MESITLDLRAEYTREPRQPWPTVILLFMGISNLLQGLYFRSEWQYFNLGLGAVALITSALVKRNRINPGMIFFNEQGISGRLPSRETVDVRWKEISRLEMKLYEIIVHRSSGTCIAIDLSECTYKQHHEVKPGIIELAKSKQIDVIG